MEEFLKKTNEAIAIADKIRIKNNDPSGMASIREVQDAMKNFTIENDMNKIAVDALERNPGKKLEIQRRIMAMFCEGKSFENSMLIK